jgi:hypothetical protein
MTGLISHFNHKKEIGFVTPTHEEGWPKSVLGRSVCWMAACTGPRFPSKGQ